MTRDTIRSIELQDIRTFTSSSVDTSGLKILIGENGAGKSTIVQACEILRSVGVGTFTNDFGVFHGSVESLGRSGAQTLGLGVRIESTDGAEPPCVYQFSLRRFGRRYDIESEELLVHQPGCDQPVVAFSRDARSFKIDRNGVLELLPLDGTRAESLLLTSLAKEKSVPSIERVCVAMANIEVHAGFDVMASWVSRKMQRQGSPLRDRLLVDHQNRVDLLGTNLASAYYTLMNELPYRRLWPEILAEIKLGFGDQIEDVFVQSAGKGHVELLVQMRGLPTPIPSSSLSNGTLAWLALVAVVHLGADRRSLLVFDEPELHFHPRLVARATQMFHRLSASHPVLLATHSRRILDLLGDEAAKATLVCELDEATSTSSIREVDPASLAQWSDAYDGLGQLTDAGYLPSVLKP